MLWICVCIALLAHSAVAVRPPQTLEEEIEVLADVTAVDEYLQQYVRGEVDFPASLPAEVHEEPPVSVLSRSAGTLRDPDSSRDIQSLITGKGYPLETHHITTEDGYILTAFRIPRGRHMSKGVYPPVLLQHGLLDNAATWVINMEHQSLPFVLADAGYDVWMPNSRGNRHSLRHKSMTHQDKAFWQFSFDHMSKYDVEANLRFILDHTGFEKLTYIGHSQGTTQFFGALTLKPELQHHISSFVGLGPVGVVTHQRNWFLKLLATFHVDVFVQFFGVRSFLVPGDLSQSAYRRFCYWFPNVCQAVVGAIAGWNWGAVNSTRWEVIGNVEPGGTSVQNLQHWSQAVRSGRWQMFDYGKRQNRQQYGSDSPPLYPTHLLKTIQVPMVLITGEQDVFSDPDDCKDLVDLLPSGTEFHSIPKYAHLDYLWAWNANEVVYPKFMDFILQHAEPHQLHTARRDAQLRGRERQLSAAERVRL